MAPEQRNEEFDVTTKIDIFALGCLYGSILLKGKRDNGFLFKTPEKICNLLVACLNDNPENRPNAAKVLEILDDYESASFGDNVREKYYLRKRLGLPIPDNLKGFCIAAGVEFLE